MPWSLEIHHLGVGQGDSTLILAKEWDNATPANLVRIRSALVDGGDAGSATILRPYIRARGVTALDVIVVTHYDEDHLLGIIELLEQDTGVNLCRGTRLYDQGRAPNGTEYATSKDSRAFHRYARAALRHGSAVRQTREVNSFYITHLDQHRIPQPPVPANYVMPEGLTNITVRDPWALLGTDVLWDGATGGTPPGAPTLTCISANKYVAGQHGRVFCSTVERGFADEYDSDEFESVADYNKRENRDSNGKSLGFVLRFGSFRYYLGGDLTSTQEDPLAAGLNPADTPAGRVHAMKASHHGSGESTGNVLVNRLRPSAVFFSCGRANTFDHPHPDVIARVEGAATVQRYYVAELPYRTTIENHGTRWRGKDTGYASVTELAHRRKLPLDCTNHTDCVAHKCVVAMESGPLLLALDAAYKHAVLTVTHAEANPTPGNPVSFTVRIARPDQRVQLSGQNLPPRLRRTWNSVSVPLPSPPLSVTHT
jgi:beta-lactamase superfamily II metal-dependent hydrolase